jgi:hypothetical protein
MEELKKFLNPIFFAIIIICFFLPFFNLMCQQQKIASVTGFDLISGTTISTSGVNKALSGLSVPQTEINKGLKTDTVAPEPLALIVFILAIAGLLISFFGKIADIGSAIISLLGSFCLIFLSSTVTDNILGKVHYQPLAVECASGYYIALLLFVLLLIYNSYLFSQRMMYKPADIQAYGAKMRFCPKCGSMNDVASIYCNSCGNNMV